MAKQPKMRRVVVYVEDKDYALLRSQLILNGVSVSQWVRTKIKQLLSRNEA